MQEKGETIRLSISLDSTRDVDIVAWLNSVGSGSRSGVIREAIRRCIGNSDRSSIEQKIDTLLELVSNRAMFPHDRPSPEQESDEVARNLGGLGL